MLLRVRSSKGGMPHPGLKLPAEVVTELEEHQTLLAAAQAALIGPPGDM